MAQARREHKPPQRQRRRSWLVRHASCGWFGIVFQKASKGESHPICGHKAMWRHAGSKYSGSVGTQPKIASPSAETQQHGASGLQQSAQGPRKFLTGASRAARRSSSARSSAAACAARRSSSARSSADRTRTSSHTYPAVHPTPSGCTLSSATETTVPTCQLLPRSRHSTRSLSLKRCVGGCGIVGWKCGTRPSPTG